MGNYYICRMPKKSYLENLERITGVNSEVDELLKNIAKNIGITKSQLIRKKAREKLAEYSPELKVIKPKAKTTTIDITEMSPKIKQEIVAVASNKGIHPNALWKIMLYEIVQSFPENMKKPYID